MVAATTTTIHARHPREIDNVLLRMPAELKKLVAETAKGEDLSQNAFITTSLLFSVIVWGELPRIGKPQNVIKLLNEMDSALQNNDAVLGAFHVEDWDQVESLVESIAASGVICGLKTRRDPASNDTVAYTFTFSKSGEAQWKTMGPSIRESVIKRCQDTA